MATVDEGEESYDEADLSVEILAAKHEAFGMHFKAKQRIAEIKKLGQYYRKPVDNEERKKIISEKMKTNPCHTRGQLGHWSRECPMKAQAVLASASMPKDVPPLGVLGVRHRAGLGAPRRGGLSDAASGVPGGEDLPAEARGARHRQPSESSKALNESEE